MLWIRLMMLYEGSEWFMHCVVPVILHLCTIVLVVFSVGGSDVHATVYWFV